MKYSLRSELRRLLILSLVMILLCTVSGCKQKDDPTGETLEAPTSASEPTMGNELIIVDKEEAEPITVPATMGTVITGKLNIRKEPGSQYESVGHYIEGDRIEIQETTQVDDTLWGRTGKGWVGMGYVRMDDVPVPAIGDLVSNGNAGILGYGVVDLGSLNVRFGPGTSYDKVKEVSEGARYAFYEESEDWVRIESGWVSKEYFYIEGKIADDSLSGSINTEELKIRSGPSTEFKILGTYTQGETVEILGQVDKWGYTEKGWISMNYVDPVEPTYTTGSGMVTSGLNIRKEPNADSEIVGTYQKGDAVTVIEINDGWGKTDKGWINLQYVKMG